MHQNPKKKLPQLYTPLNGTNLGLQYPSTTSNVFSNDTNVRVTFVVQATLNDSLSASRNCAPKDPLTQLMELAADGRVSEVGIICSNRSHCSVWDSARQNPNYCVANYCVANYVWLTICG